jgi:thiamine transporter ThiT
MPPVLLFSFLIACIYGTLFYLWRGRTLRELPLYLIAAVLGFSLGELAGNAIGLDAFMIGPLHIVEASLASWGMLFIARWLKV